MRNILILAGTALVLFALSAGLSLYLTNASKPADESSAKEKEKEKEKKPREKAKSSDAIEPVVGESPSKSAEEAAQLVARLKQRSADVEKREKILRDQEQRLQIVADELRGERVTIDALRKQISDELSKLDQKAQAADKKARDLDEQKQAAADLLAKMEKRRVAYETDEGKNLQHLAVIADSMPPEKAARILKQMADSGEIDAAAKLIFQMRERRAAAVLAEITDVALAEQLLRKVRGLQPAPPPTKTTP